MDLRYRSKAFNIISSILILIFVLGTFATFVLPQLMTITANGVIGETSTESLVMKAYSELELLFTGGVSNPTIEYIINSFVPNAGFFVVLAVTGIICFVNFIIILVKTIQGLAGKDNGTSLVKSILQFVTSVVSYVAFLLAINHVQDDIHADTIGYGPIAMLGCALALFVICAIIRISTDDNKSVASRVFKVIISFLSLLVSVAFYAVIFVAAGRTYNMFNAISYTFQPLIAATSSTAAAEIILNGSMALLGLTLLFAGVSTFSKLILAAFEVVVRKDEDEPRDVGTSLIVRSILATVFTGGGLMLFMIFFTKLWAPAVFNYSIYLMAIVATGVVCLVLSIIHKCISKKAEHSYSGDKDKPTPKPQSTTSAPKKIEDNNSSFLKIAIEPEENEILSTKESDMTDIDAGNVNNLKKKD